MFRFANWNAHQQREQKSCLSNMTPVFGLDSDTIGSNRIGAESKLQMAHLRLALNCTIRAARSYRNCIDEVY